jgi:hypothetical protein
MVWTEPDDSDGAPRSVGATRGGSSAGFSDRWVDDEFHITVGGATGVDILDRHRSQFRFWVRRGLGCSVDVACTT